ncbi:hypothetical protein ACFQ1L_24060 [Phytohabitans flavus]|nr:hypothetical protein [Phytohabitans flavus]
MPTWRRLLHLSQVAANGDLDSQHYRAVSHQNTRSTQGYQGDPG